MLRILALAGALLCALTVGSEARQRHNTAGLHPDCNITMPCAVPSQSTADEVRMTRGRYVARQVGFGVPVERRAVRAPKANLQGNRAGSKVGSYSAPSPSVGGSAVRAVAASIVAHPAGCPSRAFCGCGVRPCACSTRRVVNCGWRRTR